VDWGGLILVRALEQTVAYQLKKSKYWTLLNKCQRVLRRGKESRGEDYERLKNIRMPWNFLWSSFIRGDLSREPRQLNSGVGKETCDTSPEAKTRMCSGGRGTKPAGKRRDSLASL